MTMSDRNAQRKSIYVVLGMPRSGTSAVTRGLKALGIDLGDHFGAGTNKWNPTGYWEDHDIVHKINRGVSYALNDTWMSVHLINDECRNNPALDLLKQSAVKLLRERMSHSEHWGFKDPRTCRILPFWQDVFTALNVNEHYILALRNPLASAASWQKLSGADIELGLLVWLAHLIPAVDDMRGKKCVVVSYEAMLQDPRKELERIKNGLDIPTLTTSADTDAYVEGFLDKKLQHHSFDDDSLKSHPAIVVAPLCAVIYDLLMKVARDEMTLESKSFASAWKNIKTEFSELYPAYCYLNTLLKRNKELERELRTIRRSIPWKIILPLRIIDNSLRFFRRTLRDKRKLLKAYET